MSVDDKRIHHFLFATLPFWGHTRAACILAARIVKEHDNLIVTFVIAPAYLKNAEVEITAELDSGEVASPETRQRVRFLSICHPPPTADFVAHIMLMFQSYPTVYKTLLEAKPVTCATTGKALEAVVAPSAFFVDAYASPLIPMTRAITGETVPIISLLPVHASYIIHLHGPEEMGGNGDLGAKIDAEAARLGVTAKEIGDKVFFYTEGKINKVPGLPPMYDWEHFPQNLENNTPVSDFLRLAYAGFKTCDAFFSLSAYDFEPVSVDALKAWFAKEWNKDVYTVGPLLASKPTKYGVSSNNGSLSSEIEVFLDKSLKQYGEKSLVLLSFGSLFWPSNPEYIEEVVEALIEKKFPFIVSYASPFAKFSDDLINKINATGSGLISKWIPQKFVLNHPATGWFITHAGQSSVLESLDSGIPMMCWPFKFDQPPVSAYLSECLKTAFELVEVRTGESGMKPLFRNGRKPQGTREAVGVEIREVLDACRGEKGEELRKSAEDTKAKFGRSWGPDGVSRKDFNAFLDKFGIDLLPSASRL